MTQNWKSRSTYGLILKNKIEKFRDILQEMGETLEEKGLPDDNEIERYIAISKAQDYSISIQLMNIKSVEEFEILEKLERWKDELLAGRSKTTEEPILATDWHYRGS